LSKQVSLRKEIFELLACLLREKTQEKRGRENGVAKKQKTKKLSKKSVIQVTSNDISIIAVIDGLGARGE